MRRRRLTKYEQPEKLHGGLQKARLIELPPPLPRCSKTSHLGTIKAMVAWAVTWMWIYVKNSELGQCFFKGVPHGVENATLYVRCIKVERTASGKLEYRFCPTQNYQVLTATIRGGDRKPYPSIDRTFLSLACKEPSPGYHTARARVTVNGSVHIHVEAFDVEISRDIRSALANT